MSRTWEKLAYTPKEVAKLLGVHINTVYKLVKIGALKHTKAGTKTLIPAWSLEEYLGMNKAPREGREE